MVIIKQQIASGLQQIVKELTGLDIVPQVDAPSNKNFGDYSTNVAMAVSAKLSHLRGETDKHLEGESKRKVKTPMEIAKGIIEEYTKKYPTSIHSDIEKVEIVVPGFINFRLSKKLLISDLQRALENKQVANSTLSEKSKFKVMVEYAHPNTHKEMHIGHMRTLITGEAIARILQANGAKVFRANYQGDIGPHVAKALYGVQKLMKEENLTLSKIDKKSNAEKAHFLGKAYALGNQDYKEHKEEIDGINARLYAIVSSSSVIPAKAGIYINNSSGSRVKPGMTKRGDGMTSLSELYKITRKWSLDYYDELYKKFGAKFDRLFFESEMADCGKKIVLENAGSPRGEASKVFEEDKGAIVFKGEKYNLHTRVFVTKAGYPTYEGKEMCLGFKEYEAFPFDLKVHVVASEQSDYFKVVFKALEVLDPEKFVGKQKHLSMGMIQMKKGKMSSRTGDVLTVDWLIDTVKSKVLSSLRVSPKADEAISIGDRRASLAMTKEDEEKTIEQVVIGAIKYSVLKVNTEKDAVFDINKSVSLEGDSGPYLQYTYARTQSVLAKAPSSVIPTSPVIPAKVFRLRSRPSFDPEHGRRAGIHINNSSGSRIISQRLIVLWTKCGMTRDGFGMTPEELFLLRLIHLFPEVIEEAGEKLAPNIICSYLFELAQAFNLFYQKVPILKERHPGKRGTSASRIPRGFWAGQNDEETGQFRIALTTAVGKILKEGLNLLGIEAPARM